MGRTCSVCAHADAEKINAKLLDGVSLESLAKAYGLAVTSLHRHQKNHIPAQLAKATEAPQVASADSLMERVATLDERAKDVYSKALRADNLTAAIGAIRELRGITELYAKITGELQAQAAVNVNNVIVSPEWMSLRSAILTALEPYPEARQAILTAIRKMDA